MFFNRILPKPVWLPEVMQRTTPEELEFLRSHPRLQTSIAEFATVNEVLAMLPRFQAAAAAAKAGPVPQLISGTANTCAEPEWVWPHRIARGKLELRRSVVELDMVRDIAIDGGDVTVTIALTVAGCPLRSSFEEQVARALQPVRGVEHVRE